jgi:hypothetical protein
MQMRATSAAAFTLPADFPRAGGLLLLIGL